MEQYTDGSYRCFIDQCPYCTMSTGGEHEIGCPNRGLSFVEPFVNDYKYDWMELYDYGKVGAYKKRVGYVKYF